MNTYTFKIANKESNLLEKLVALEHIQWMSWAKNIIKNENLSKTSIKKWESYFIPYEELPDEIKELDRNYARKILELINSEEQIP